MIAFTYIGAIIGAGFASGQEIRKYFVDYGAVGFLCFILVSFLFMFLGEKLMNMGYTSGAESYERVLGYAFSCKARKFFDYVICFFLIATGSAMFSGCGAFLNQIFGLNLAVGSAIMAVATFGVIAMGLKAVMKVSTIVVPILIIATSVISITSLGNADLSQLTIINEIGAKSLMQVVWSGIVYVAYNLVMCLAVLPALGAVAKNKKEIRKGSLVAGLIIALFGSIVFFALFANYDKIQGVEIPIAALTKNSQMFMYGMSFIIAVLTTAVGAMYGVFTRVKKNLLHFSIVVVVAYLLSLIGFSVLVAKLYYVMGVFGVVLIGMLLYGYGKRKERT